MISISGAKNSALPIISACLLKRSIYLISDVPKIIDVEIQLKILRQFNVSVEYIDRTDNCKLSSADNCKLSSADNSQLKIDTRQMVIPLSLNFDDNCRGSYYFMYVCLFYHCDL